MKSDKIVEKLIYLVILGIPLYLVKITIGAFPTNIFEVGVGIIFLIWLFSNQKKISISNFFAKYSQYVYVLGLIVMGLLLSTISSGNAQVSWGIVKGWFLVPIVFVMLCGRFVKKDKLEQIFLMYFFSATIIALIAIIYFLGGFLTYDGRLEAIFNSPNYLAMYLSPAVIIFIFQIKKDKIKLILPMGLIVITLYLTYSYATWLAVIISVVITLYWKHRNNLKKSFFVNLLLVAVVVLILIFSQKNNDKFKAIVELNKRSSIASRMIVWRASQQMIKDNFWLGIGPGNFQKNYLQYQKFYAPYLEWEMPHPNNLYLTFWLYGGVFGLMGFLGLVALFFQRISQEIKIESKRILFMALGIMLIILIHGIFDTTYFKNDLALVFWLTFLVLKK
jgi:O-antigen ligase